MAEARGGLPDRIAPGAILIAARFPNRYISTDGRGNSIVAIVPEKPRTQRFEPHSMG